MNEAPALGRGFCFVGRLFGRVGRTRLGLNNLTGIFEKKQTMKFEKQVVQEFDVKFIDIFVPVCYGEEDIPNDFPGRIGNEWKVRVEIETGKILNWPNGVAADFSMKVIDEGSYYLIDENGNAVASIEENYVPNGVVPGKYGDYIEMEINEQGVITNWPKSPNLSAFSGQEED